MKTLIVAILLAGVVPLLLGLLFELVIVAPLRVPLDQTPLFYPWQVSCSHSFAAVDVRSMGCLFSCRFRASEHFPQICLFVAEKRQPVWMWGLFELKGYAEEFKLWKAELLWDDIKGCISVISYFSSSIIVKFYKKSVYLYVCMHRCTYSIIVLESLLHTVMQQRGSGDFFFFSCKILIQRWGTLLM